MDIAIDSVVADLCVGPGTGPAKRRGADLLASSRQGKMASAAQISCRNLGRQSWASAPTGRKGGPINHLGQRSVCVSGRKGWVWGAAEIIPKVSSNLGQSLSRLTATAPFAQGSLWGRGYGLPRRFAPRNDSSDPLSFRGGPTGRRGNPSFFRWTGVRAAVPRAWPPPAKFRPQHRAAASSAPTKRRDSCRNHPSQRRAAKRPRPRPRGMGGNRRKNHPQRGPPPRPPRQRLAKRKARR